jgi:hypothetical protein
MFIVILELSVPYWIFYATVGGYFYPFLRSKLFAYRTCLSSLSPYIFSLLQYFVVMYT